MIDLTGLVSIPFLKKSRFTGSYCGMRYMLQKGEREEKTVLLATIWPEPFNWETTEDGKKHTQEFSFDPDGISESVVWLNQEHEAGNY